MSRASQKKTTSILPLRVTPEEKAKFIKLADGTPVSRYIIDAILKHGKRAPKSLRKLDKDSIAQLLGVLGKSRISNNINQLAKAANSGSLPVNEDVIKALNESVAAILWMRDTLIKALGLKSVRFNEDASNDPEG